jgi:hypothetical protein
LITGIADHRSSVEHFMQVLYPRDFLASGIRLEHLQYIFVNCYLQI